VPLSRAVSAAVWLRVALVSAIGWFYFWTVVPESAAGLVSMGDSGYYNLLARGFLRGHLYLDAKADPYLATLRNPWDPAEHGEHGMADVSYFRGRYYIYFGVSPAVLLFLPFRLLTGRFVSEVLALPLFAALGFLASVQLLTAARRRYFPSASEFLVLASILALGLADMMPVLLRRPSVREVPVACGYACCMAAFAAIFQAMHARRPGVWLAAAGAALGFAVGSRPLYLLACPVVLLPVWLEARERGLGLACWRDRAWRRLALAAVLPLALVGLGLAAYNYFRFGNPAEFGLRYQIWLEDPALTQRFAWRFAAYNLRAYWLAPAGWIRYFPFVTEVALPPAPAGFYGTEDPYGILPNMPFAFLALGVFALAAGDRPGAPGRLRVLCAGVGLTAAVMTLSLLPFQAALNRYMVDFLPSVMLLACLGLLALTARRWHRGAAAVLLAAAACALAGYSAAFNVLASFRHNELFRASHPAIYARVAHRFNWLSYASDRWRKTAYGPLEMKVIFPTGRAGAFEPLVVTGRTFLSDYLFVHYLGSDSVQFGLEHTSRGTFLGRPVPARPGEVHDLRIDLGSLYPPAAHPYFDAMAPAEAQLRQDTARVTMDGQVVLARELAFYDPEGPVPSIGSAEGRIGFAQAFSGRILSWRRMPEASLAPPWDSYGAFYFKLKLPPFTTPHNEPLLCTGRTGRGDLLYVRHEGPGRISFGYDHWGVSSMVSPPVSVDPGAEQFVEADFGGLHRGPAVTVAEDSGPGRRAHLEVRLNGRPMLDGPALYFPCDPGTIFVGLNTLRNSTADAVFSGDRLEAGRVPEPPASLYGAFRLELTLPRFTTPRNEPLISTGQTGRGDLIYVRYESPNQVSFGYDHWGVGGVAGPPQAVDRQARQVMEIDFEGLHGPGPATATSGAGLNGRVMVRLNGRVALDGPASYYPCAPGTVAVGRNAIHASTAAEEFSGDLIKAERIPEPAIRSRY
jgi:hypothetical protein